MHKRNILLSLLILILIGVLAFFLMKGCESKDAYQKQVTLLDSLQLQADTVSATNIEIDTNLTELAPQLSGKEYLKKGMEAYRVMDFKSAFSYFSSAVAQEETEAYYFLGRMYHNGEGIEQNFSEALRLYKQGVVRGDVKANFGIGYMYFKGEGLGTDFEKARATHQKALGAIQKSADAGNYFWQYRMGRAYQDNDQGRYAHKEESMKYYRLSAAQDFWAATYNLATNLWNEGKENYHEASALFLKSAMQGFSMAQYAIGNSYRWGQGVEQDFSKAYHWYEKAARQKYSSGEMKLRNAIRFSQFMTGWLLYEGKGVKQDYKKAFEWFEKAAKDEVGNAKYYLALCHDEGKGTKQDWVKAAYWYKMIRDEGIDSNGNNKDWFYDAYDKYYEIQLFGLLEDKKRYDIGMYFPTYRLHNGTEKERLNRKIAEEITKSKYLSVEGAQGDKMEVRFENKPLVVGKAGTKQTFDVKLTLMGGKKAKLGLATKAFEDFQEVSDEINITDYTILDDIQQSGVYQLSISNKKPTRTIGYVYLIAEISGEEKLSIKIPQILAWIP